MSVLKLETMSTDESDVEDGEEVLVVHPLPWISETVCDLKRALDQQIRMSKTPQAKGAVANGRVPSLKIAQLSLNKSQEDIFYTNT